MRDLYSWIRLRLSSAGALRGFIVSHARACRARAWDKGVRLGGGPSRRTADTEFGSEELHAGFLAFLVVVVSLHFGK